MAGWWQQLETDAEAMKCADANEHQAASSTADPRPPQRVPDMNPPSASRSEPRTSPENEPGQHDRAARLDELLARADQAARRIAARQASRAYAARTELETQTQAEAGSRHKPGTKPNWSCNAAARARSRTSPLIRLSIRATACASLPHA
jgi:hypothetical protein